MTRRLRPARRLLMVAAAGLVVTLAGCGQTVLAGSAAVVGDARLADSTVASSADEIRAALGGRPPEGGAAELNRALIGQFVTSTLIGVAAQREGVTVTAGEVAATRDRIVEGAGGPEALPQYAAERSVAPSQVDTAILASLQYSALAAKLAPGGDEQAQADAVNSYLGALSTDLGTEVSPRFGTWEPNRLNVGIPPQDLSRPVAPENEPAAASPAPQAS